MAFYAALNLDAALLARAGNHDQAVRVADEAAKVERSRPFVVVADFIRDNAGAGELGLAAAIVVRTIALDRGSALWQVLPGIDVSGPGAHTASRSNPFEEAPRPLTEEHEGELAGLLAAGPTVRTLAPVAIARRQRA